MKKQISVIIVITLMIQLLFNIIFPIASMAAGEETVTITCKDVNFYNKLKEQLDGKIQSSVDGTMTITMTKANVESITSIRVYNYQKPEETLVTDITGIENFTNLTSLDLSGNNISDIEPLKDLINLTSLDLFYNKIIDISPIENLTNLKKVDLGWNEISDITVLSKLKNLEDIDLSENRISTLEPFRNLTKLKSLDLYQATRGIGNIGNLSDLENLTNLTYLSLRSDGITDIQPLSKLIELEYLDLYANHITEIEVLSKFTKLAHLNLGCNNISDMSAIENIEELSSFEAEDQQLIGTNKDGVVQLPKIFKQAKTEDSKCYTAEDFELVNCTLNKDISAVTMTNKTIGASVKIKGGSADGTKLTLEDTFAPKLTTSYSTTLITNQDVTATITANEQIQGVTGWTLSQDKMSLTKVYTENSSKETVTVKDLVENSATIDVEVTNIDKVAPKATVSYATTGVTNKDVIVTITANEKIQQVQGWQISDDLTTLTKVYTENSPKETIEVKDLAGNSTTVEVQVNNIDKAVLNANVSYSTTELTNQDVVVTITANEQIQEVSGWKLSTDKKSLTKTYSKNVEKETVTIKGLTGNTTTVDISIKNIDKVAPKPSVSYTSTNTSATVTIKVDEKIQQVEDWRISDDLTTLTKTYTQNTQEEITIKDLAGNAVKVNIKVMNIPENSNNSQNQSEKAKVDSSTSEKGLPYTGINYIEGIAIVVVIIAVVYFKKLRNLKGIK